MSTIPLAVQIPGSGTLALAGSGEYLPGMNAVDSWLIQQLQAPARVVTLATAAGTEGPERLGYWDHLAIQHFSALGVESVQPLPVIDRISADNQRQADLIRQANFVYLSGGKPGYLYQTLNGTAVWEAICSVLVQGGVVAGCSAGAMVFGQYIPAIRPPWKLQPGFGFLPDTFIVPHFDEIPSVMRQGLLAMHKSHQMVGIDGDTILACTAHGCTVRGRNQVTISEGNHFLHFRQDSEI